MNSTFYRTLIALLILVFSFVPGSATSIAPFQHLGEAAEVSSHIVMVEAKGVDTIINGNTTSFTQHFEIIDRLKGDCFDNIEIEKLSRHINGGYMAVAGDISYTPGNRYLLFLRERGEYDFYPTCSSYYIYQIENIGKRTVAFPIFENGSLRVETPVTKESAHHVFDYNLIREAIVSHLREKKNWDQSAAELGDADIISSISYKMNPPQGCNYLTSGTLKTRWQFAESQAIPIHYQGYTGGCPSLTSELQSTANHINTNFTGLTVTTPTSYSGYNYGNCSNGNPYDALGNFLSSQFGNSRRIYVMFNDPCNQIPNLLNCRGTLGYGGSFWGTTHTYNSTTYLTSTTGFVIVNEGVENCYCGSTSGNNTITDFTSFMAHELTHSLGMGHISDANALMNPSCCNEINSADLSCVEFLYPPSGSQNCTHFNRTFSNITVGSSTTLADNNITVNNTVNVQGNANVIWNAENQISVNGTFTVPSGALLEIGIDDCQ